MIEQRKEKILFFAAMVCLILTVVFDLLPLSFFENEKNNFFFGKFLSLFFGFVGVALLMIKEKSGLFKKPTNLLYFLPALVIAVDNFQFAAFFAGKMQPINEDVGVWILFATYCLCTGLFEEGIFRGALFPLFAARFEKNKKGLLKAVVWSSVTFGGAHILNIFAGAGVGATLLQTCYSTLTGALFAFTLIKTKNILLCAFAHGAYNFCGLLFSAEQGLGMGVVFDMPTALTMLVVSLAVAAFAIWAFAKYTETEREELYARLGFGAAEKKE